jgi:hypothetical protein
MIVLLKEIRTGRVKALRALRVLDHWREEDDDDGRPHGIPFKPGLKEALDMVNGLPVRVSIQPEHLPLFEDEFHVQVLSRPPLPDNALLGDCTCVPPLAELHFPKMPWATIHFPGGMLAVGGGVRALADAISSLLGDGHPESSIVIEFLGGGPTRHSCGPMA